MRNLEACGIGNIKEENLFGEKLTPCYSKTCPYDNRIDFEFDGCDYQICKSSGFVKSKLVGTIQNAI